MATARLVPSTYYLSSTYLTVSSESNMYANTDSTNYGTVTNTRSGTSSYYIYLRGFDFDTVPSNAIVSKIEIKIKAYQSGGNTSTIGGYNGTTSVSSAGTTTALGTSAQVQTFTNTTIDWDTLKGYRDDFGIRINCRRSNRNTTAYVYIYGAEIDVTYTIPVYHDVSVSGAEPSGTTTLLEGSSFTARGSGYTSMPTVTDNGVDVTSQVVASSVDSLAVYPSSNTNSNFTLTTIENAYHGADNSTSARLDLAGGTTGTIYFNFGSVSIPTGATLQSVACSATLQFSRNNSSSGFTSSFQMYAGSTAKGSATNWVSSATDVAKTTYNVTMGTWTSSDLSNPRFYITATNSASSTHRYIYVYGATLTVSYSISGYIYTYTISNVTTDHTIVFSSSPSVVSVTGVTLDKSTDTVAVGSTTTLTETVSPSNATDKTVSWSTSNSSVATVSNGVVTGVSAGTTIITVTTTDGGYTAACTVTVTSGGGAVWETIFEATTNVNQDSPSGQYIWVGDYTTPFQANETYRVTWGSNTYVCNTFDFSDPAYRCEDGYAIGDIYLLDHDTGTNEPFLLWRTTYASNTLIGRTSTPVGTVYIKIEKLVGGSTPPIITVGTPSRSIISDETGYDQCVCTFQSDTDLQAWEARATKSGTTPARGVGLLVESGTTLAANTNATIYVDDEELTQGDGEYSITVYGLST